MANSQVGFLQIKLGLTGPEAIRRSGDYPRFAKRFCPLGYMGGIILGAGAESLQTLNRPHLVDFFRLAPAYSGVNRIALVQVK